MLEDKMNFIKFYVTNSPTIIKMDRVFADFNFEKIVGNNVDISVGKRTFMQKNQDGSFSLSLAPLTTSTSQESVFHFTATNDREKAIEIVNEFKSLLPKDKFDVTIYIEDGTVAKYERTEMLSEETDARDSLVKSLFNTYESGQLTTISQDLVKLYEAESKLAEHKVFNELCANIEKKGVSVSYDCQLSVIDEAIDMLNAEDEILSHVEDIANLLKINKNSPLYNKYKDLYFKMQSMQLI